MSQRKTPYRIDRAAYETAAEHRRARIIAIGQAHADIAKLMDAHDLTQLEWVAVFAEWAKRMATREESQP